MIMAKNRVILQSLSGKINFYIKNPLKIALSRDKICPSQKKAVSLHTFSQRAYAQALCEEQNEQLTNKIINQN